MKSYERMTQEETAQLKKEERTSNDEIRTNIFNAVGNIVHSQQPQHGHYK